MTQPLLTNKSQETTRHSVSTALQTVYTKPVTTQKKLTDSPPTNGSTERRTFPRRTGTGIVQILRDNPFSELSSSNDGNLRNSTLKGILSNISKKGISFILNESATIKESLQLRIFNPKIERYSIITATVNRCTPAGTNNWKVACQFSKTLTLEQLNELGHHFKHQTN